MKAKLIYPVWRKLNHQPEFFLPPHGPVVFAAALPADVDVSFTDENVEPIDFTESCDVVFMSVMLTCQIKRAWEIADTYRAMGKPVIFGGIATQLHAEETKAHADSVFLGEAEGRMQAVIDDVKQGRLKPVYDYFQNFPDTALIGPARRDILNRDCYNFRGVQMVDLVHASRGCRFNCFPCCTPFLGGRQFRPRPIDQVIEEMAGIDNDRLFIVDNSLAQNDQWEKDLFREMAPLKKKWVSHPIKHDDEILKLAAEAGAWYVYQAVIDTSDHIRNRIKRYKDFGIGVEGTIILGTDDHDVDAIKRLVDFLMDVDLDLAEFTIMTPFPHTPIRRDLEKEGRILHSDWNDYTCDRCVFKPAKMTPDELEEMYDYAWETFYSNCGKELQMAKLYLKAVDQGKRAGLRIRPPRDGKKWGGGS
ncbi:MAG: cobalamin-dependent protein [Lentisphaeria bacterium]|nr:cobalamin-dependent protein [Lentisphaeria bacterium]